MQRVEAVEAEHRPGRLEAVQPLANLGVRKGTRCNHGLAAALPITFGAKGRPMGEIVGRPMGEIVQEWTITERVRWLGPQRLRR